MSCCGIRNPFAFNLADAAIFGGAALLILFAGPGATAGAAQQDVTRPAGLR